MPRVKTVSILTDNGPVLINATDFDPAKHQLVGAAPGGDGAKDEQPAPGGDGAKAPPAAPPAPPAPPVPPAPPAPPATADKYVTKIGKEWFITDESGKKLDETAYKNEADAQAAIAPAN